MKSKLPALSRPSRRTNRSPSRPNSGDHNATLLKESLQLQEGLRQLTHRHLRAQEKYRLTMSHKLQDEIAQTLLGIHVRLLSLKTMAQSGTKNLTIEIARVRRLVKESIRSINRFAHELSIHPAPRG